MSETLNTAPGPDHLLEARGVTRATDAFIVACAFSRDSRSIAFGDGDGYAHLVARDDLAGDWRRIEAHDGATLALAADARREGFVSGGDDGRLVRFGLADDAPEVLGKGGRWVEKLATWEDGQKGNGGGLIASSRGKQVELRDAAGTVLKTLDHPTTVQGLAFDAKGKRIVAAHYNAVSLWFANAKVDTPRLLNWKGSHLDVVVHPGGEAVVSAMQENALHGWRLPDGHNMRMSGYAAKPTSLSFSRNGKWLATSGADVVVLWPFFAGGPMGKPPLELAGMPGVLCTKVAFHPVNDIVAAAYADGTVLLAEVTSQRLLPVCGPGRGSVSALAFSPDGATLAFGTETGTMATVDLSARG